MGGKHFADRWLVSQSGLLDGHGGGGQSCVAKVRGHMALLWARSGQLVGLAVGGFAIMRIMSVCLLGGERFKRLALSWAGVRGEVGAACRALHRSPVCVRFAFSAVFGGVALRLGRRCRLSAYPCPSCCCLVC